MSLMILLAVFSGTCPVTTTESFSFAMPDRGTMIPSDNSKKMERGQPLTDSTSSGVAATNIVAIVMSLVVVGACVGVCAAFVAVVIRVRHRRKKFYRQTEVRK